MSRVRPLKAYVVDNYDGIHSAMVAARTLVAAASLLRTTRGHMRTYGWYLATGDDALRAIANPGKRYRRHIMSDAPWQEF